MTSRPGQPQSRRPILVTGSPRSGTTWVGKVIAMSPDVFPVYEPMNPDAPHPLPVASRFQVVTEDGPAALQRGLADLCQLGDAGFRLRRTARGLLEAGRAEHDLCGRLAAAALRDGASFSAASRALIKDPLALYAARWLATHYDAQLVLTCREPVGVVSSYLALGWRSDVAALLGHPIPNEDRALAGALARRTADGPGDLVGDLILQWRVLTAKTLWLFGAVPNAILLSHQELCRAPHDVFEVVFDRLGLDYDDRIRQRVSALTRGSRGAGRRGVQHDHHRDTSKLAEAARDRLTSSVISRIEAETGDDWHEVQRVCSPPVSLRARTRRLPS